MCCGVFDICGVMLCLWGFRVKHVAIFPQIRFGLDQIDIFSSVFVILQPMTIS